MPETFTTPIAQEAPDRRTSFTGSALRGRGRDCRTEHAASFRCRVPSDARRQDVVDVAPTGREEGRGEARASAAAVVPRFEHGSLAVVDVEDGQVSGYCVAGLVLDVHAKSLPDLLVWTLSEAKLGAPKLARPGKDANPLIVLARGRVRARRIAGAPD